MNLLLETKDAIRNSGHTIENIRFIGSEQSGHCCTWDEFRKLADIEYDHSYGYLKVAIDLVIVFDDGSSMWRNEYDGLEWWEFAKPFIQPDQQKPIFNLAVSPDQVGWKTLSELNQS